MNVEFGRFGAKHMAFITKPIEQDARINILEGSVRSGKTVGMMPKWINYILHGPPGLLIMTGVSKETLEDNVLRDLFDTVGTENYTYNKQSGLLVIYGRLIKVLGAKDQGSEKYLRGKTISGAYCDEISLMPEEFFKQLLNRMSVKGAKLYATTNPDTPYHYLYTDYITDEEKLESGMVKVYHFELDDNPNLDEEYKTFIRNAYTGFWYLRMIEGKWVQAQGSIYDMWDSRLNTFDDDDLDASFMHRSRRFVSCDHGTQNATVFLDIHDDGETVWVLNEYYHSGRNEGVQKENSEYADEMEKFIGDTTDRFRVPRYIIIDPAAATFKITVRKRGWHVKDADNEVNPGISMVSTLIAQRRLRVHRTNCPNLLKEIAGYVWDERALKLGMEKPLKQNDHACDALRYFVRTMIPERRLYTK